jgi:peptidoglycan/LPS O-acetylase OafA/YrhL
MFDRLRVDHLGVLDGLRACAIVLVVWFHLWLVSGYVVPVLGFAQPFVQSGYLGVDLFFFISGCCIALPYARARARGVAAPTAGEFAQRRVRKILPSYFLALTVFAIAFHDRFDGPLTLIAHVAAHAAFVHVFSPATFGSLSGPLWTLGIEVQFYVLFALLARFITRRPLTVYACFVAVAVAYRATIAALGIDTDFGWLNQLPAVLDIFGAGVLAAFAHVAFSKAPRWPRPALATLVAAGALVAVAAAFAIATSIAASDGDDAVHRWLNAWRVTFGPVLLLATLGLSFGSARLRSFAGSPPLKNLSIVSYGAYLFNLEIVVALGRLGMPPAAVFWLGAFGTLLVAAAVTYGFERPLARFGFRAPAVSAPQPQRHADGRYASA